MMATPDNKWATPLQWLEEQITFQQVLPQQIAGVQVFLFRFVFGATCRGGGSSSNNNRDSIEKA